MISEIRVADALLGDLLAIHISARSGGQRDHREQPNPTGRGTIEIPVGLACFETVPMPATAPATARSCRSGVLRDLLTPASPLCEPLERGMTTVRSCRMIDAEMYGMIRARRSTAVAGCAENRSTIRAASLHLIEELGQRVPSMPGGHVAPKR